MSKTVKLGLMPPLTGLVEIYGSEIHNAGLVACQEVNEAGGVLGKPLELLVEDDGSLPESAVKAATKLVDKQCSAIIGNLLSNSRIAVAYRVAEPQKTPLLNFSFYEGSILSRYFFHFAALPNQQIHKMIPYMREHFGPKMFFAGNNYEWPRGSIDAGKLALHHAKGEIVGEEYLPIGVSPADIESLLDHVEATQPDVFVPYFAGSDQVELLTRFTQRGLKEKIAVVMGHYDEMMASILSPEVREGFYSTNTYFMTVDTAENQDYLKRLEKLPHVDGIWPGGNGILTNFGEGTYVCVKAFAKAANMAGSLNPEDLVEALKHIRVAAPQGMVQMNPVHHHARVNTFLSRCDREGHFKLIEKFGLIEPHIPERYNHQRISHQATVEDDIRLQARMLEQMTEAVFLVNSDDNRVLYTNAGAERMYGYEPGEMVGMDFFKFSVLKQEARLMQSDLKQKGQWTGEVKNSTRRGNILWVSTSVSTFTHPIHGEVWLAIQRDITDKKQAEQELARYQNHLEHEVKVRTADLEEARDIAEKASQAKNEFLSRMSHELRTPLNAILGFSQVLIADDLEQEHISYIEEIYNAGEHLLVLITELLDLSRIEAGTLTANVESVVLLKSVQEALTIVQPLIGEKQITVKLAVDSDIFVKADSTRLNQILINLLSNAAKYNKLGGSIKVAAKITPKNNVRITVSDTGIGIAEDKLKEMFTPFNRLGAEHSGIDGTGIGMALSKQLVEIMDGTIGVESKISHGSSFYVELPADDQILETQQQEKSTTRLLPGAKTILYVEDNIANLKVVEAIFKKKSNIRIISAVNADDGLKRVREENPDVIILDIHLPGRSGYDILKELQEDETTCEIPVIALSADAMPADVERGLKAGFKHYLSKPVKMNQLLAILNEMFGDQDHVA
ncbi:MAG: transporter substrate-binding protein [Gammaproteobacteria bacterium]|nr:transporter substrate-binding protein [Gammaproteobacteria bacterium]MDH5802671.1 transporter substrate-binding protein [Gammaproteobacteria bacterium]